MFTGKIGYSFQNVTRGLVSVLALSCFLSTANATDRCGSVCNETWTLGGSPYVATCDVTVAAGCSLTVDAGVEVRFVAAAGLVIDGSLNVNGTAANAVVFQSSAPSPTPGSWDGLRLQGSGQATIDHAAVSYAVSGVYATGNAVMNLSGTSVDHSSSYGIYVDSRAAVTLTGVTSRYNRFGLIVYGSSPPPVVTSTGGTFTNNTLYGVSVVGPTATVSVRGGAIHSNGGGYDFTAESFANAGERVVDATGNWWGTTSAAAIGPRILDHGDQASSPIVDWCGYLASAGGVPWLDVHCPDLAVCGETASWDLTDKPYYMTSDVVVCPTGTLEIGPGVNVRAAAGASAGIVVDGTLHVNGTAGSPVVLTSDAAVPAAGNWDGVKVEGSGQATIDHATVSYAGSGVNATGSATVSLDGTAVSYSTSGVYATGNAVVNLTGTSVDHSSSYGIYVDSHASVTLTGVTSRYNRFGLIVYGSSPPPVVTSTGGTFTNNTTYGVSVVGPTATVSVRGGAIHSNGGGYDFTAESFANAGERVVDATGNWWGTTSAAAIGPRILDHGDQASSPIVDWCGYLASAGGVPWLDVHCPDLAVCGETASWDLTDKPYYMTSDVVVCPTGTLEIGPGVNVRAAAGASAGIVVDGTLHVNGTAGSPVVLTSDAAVPAAGNWDGVKVEGSGQATIDHGTVSYAGSGVNATGSATVSLDGTATEHNTHGVYVDTRSTVTMTGVTSRYNQNGLTVKGSSPPPVVTSTGGMFTNNTIYGVNIDGQGYGAKVWVGGASIHSNIGTYDFFVSGFANPATSLVWAPDCWWRTNDIAAIRIRIYDREDSASSPRVWFRPFGGDCERALGGDADRDGLGDFEDNCPATPNAAQTDADGDGMGDACDPAVATLPAGVCDGINDTFEGHVDSDGDGWGDPCDFQPTRADSHPGAVERCDGRDNDGDAGLAEGEDVDADLDEALACGDCADLDAAIYPCACESCTNLIDDDCDTLVDLADSACASWPACIIISPGPEPVLTMRRGACVGGGPAGPYEVIRGILDQLRIAGVSVDLGTVGCVASNLVLDRTSETPRQEPRHATTFPTFSPAPRTPATSATQAVGRHGT